MFFYSLQYPDARCHVPTNKREKAAKKLRCTVRQRCRQLGSLQDLCSRARCQRHSNHLSILDLSLGGYIGLILRAGVFHHVAYEICRHPRHDTAAHTETGKSTAWECLIKTSHGVIRLQRNFCFWSIPLHLFPSAVRTAVLLLHTALMSRINLTLIDGSGHMRWQNVFLQSGAGYNSKNIFIFPDSILSADGRIGTRFMAVTMCMREIKSL